MTESATAMAQSKLTLCELNHQIAVAIERKKGCKQVPHVPGGRKQEKHTLASVLSQLPKPSKSGPVLGHVFSFRRQFPFDTHHSRKRVCFSFAMLLLAASAVLCAQPIDPAEGLPEKHWPKLGEILARAMQQSPTMLLKSIELAKADADAEMARAIRYPNLGGSARYGVEGVSTTNSPSTTSQGLFYNIGISQPLFHWGGLQAGIRIGELQMKIAERQYADAYRDLVHGIRGQFLFMMLKKRALAKARLNFELQEKNFAAEKVRFEQGQIAPGQFAVMELEMEEKRIALTREALEYDTTKNTLVRMVGLTGFGDADIPDLLPRPAWVPGHADKWVQQVMQRVEPTAMPSAQVYTYLIRQSEAKYTQARARLLPKVDFSAGTSLENQTYLAADRVEQNATTRNSASVSASWTLFDGFATRAAKRQALAEKRQAERQLQTYLESVADKRRFLTQQAELSARALEIAEKRYQFQAGTITYAEEETKAGRMSPVQLAQIKSGIIDAELVALAARVDLYLRWSELVSLLWADPQLSHMPQRYLTQDRSPGAKLKNFWPW